MDEVSVNAQKHTAQMASRISGKLWPVMLGPWHASGGELLIFLGDFVAEVATTDGTGNGGQGFAVAATHLIAQQSADNCAHADTNWTVLSHWRCGRWRRRSAILLSRPYGST